MNAKSIRVHFEKIKQTKQLAGNRASPFSAGTMRERVSRCEIKAAKIFMEGICTRTAEVSKKFHSVCAL